MTIRKSRSGVSATLPLFLGLCCIAGVRAQSGQADVQGIVSDPGGAFVAGAQVVLLNTESGDKRVVKTAPDGRYSFPTVAPGHYSLNISAPSFSPETINGLTIELDNHVNQNVLLKVGGANDTVEVTSLVPQVDTSSYDVGGVIRQDQINDLPIQNRQYLNLALLVPGTSQAASRTFYSNVQAGGGVYFYANGFSLDGVTNQQTEEGDPRQNIPEGAVAEFKTYTASMPAELGWAMGGYTTVVTKSGTNKIHGEAFEYFRNRFMNADNQFTQATELADHVSSPLYNRNQFGFDMGGPILKDKLHYYGAYEQTQQTTSYTLYAAPAYAADYSAITGTFAIPGHDDLLTLRLDGNIRSNQQAFVRYAQEWNLVSGNGCGNTSTYGCYDGQIPRHALVFGHTWEPSPRIVNEARFQYAYISYELGPYGTPVPTTPLALVSPSYRANVGVGYEFPDFTYGKEYAAVGVETRWEVNDTVTVQRGKHSVKAGFDLSYVPYIDANASNLNGTFYFSTDQAFNPANTSNLAHPYEFTQAAVPLVYYLPSTQQAYFLEDSWKAKQNLTINAGARYDLQRGSPFLNTYTPNTTTEPVIPFEGNPHTRGDWNNFGPRIGLSWDPFKKSKDVVRAGYGIYYNFVQTELSEAEKLNFIACPITIVASTGTYVPYPAPYSGYPNPGSSGASNYCTQTPANVTILSPGLSNPYQHQFTLGYSRQVTKDMSLSADGIYNRGLRDYKSYDRNYPLNYAGTTVPRPDTAIGQDIQHASTAASEYKALYLKLDKRMSNRYMFTVSYALTSALDNNPHSAPFNYNNLKEDWGPASVDQRHAVVASFAVMLPLKILAGGIFTYRSSEPFSTTTTTTTPTVFTAAMLNADGTAQLVPGTTRDSGNRGYNYAALNAYRANYNLAHPTANLSTNLSSNSVASTQYNDFDLRLSKMVFSHEAMKLEIIGQAFNLFGTENYTGITTSPTSAAWGAPTGANTVQIGELAAKFSF